MQKVVVALTLITIISASCASSVTPHQAASKNYKKCRSVR